MILEGLMTTTNLDGTVNVSPMGPLVDGVLSVFTLRPFQTSTTYRNLKRTGVGVFHVTDDVELLAHAAVGHLSPPPNVRQLPGAEAHVLVDACRWFLLRVDELDDQSERTTIVCRAVKNGEQRPFFGLNRAKHAVVEAAILATRLHLLPREDVEKQLAALRPLVEKTAGDAERRAFAFLLGYVAEHYARPVAGREAGHE
ncbi:MAG: DUF447 domain-containing protein [Pirellula sp.]|nr:DUF447 domain-containing protein [Pirellula sp.]